MDANSSTTAESPRRAPFSTDYVLKHTANHMRIAIDTSIRKTFKRLPEFANDQEKSQEIFKTLGALHAMRRDVDNFQNQDFSGN